MNILHISDVHFGVRDSNEEQPRIAEALVEAVHKHDRRPDLCIFSGDLANFGLAGELETGERWLNELVRREWNAELVVVPGNHDVERKGTRPSLFRAIAQDENVYADWARAKTVNCDHLRSFFDWHQAARSRLPLGGEWISPFGLLFRKQADPFPVHVICMNSSLFCCDDNDAKNLIIDTKTLNNGLAVAAREESLVIVVAHHPLDFLTPWNRLDVETVLAQERGAHLFLHGHQHETSASTRSDNAGAGLTTLAAGAAYQGSKWRQEFSFYEFDFHKREITPRVYRYGTKPGNWVEDLSQSRPFVADIPFRAGPSPARKKPGPPPPGVAEAAATNEPVQLSSPSIAPAEPEKPAPEAALGPRTTPRAAEPDLGQLAQEVDARRHAASNVQSRVLQYFSETEIDAHHYYAVTSRIKRAERIIEKYIDRKSEKPDYQLEMMTDICGFRIVTRYQDEIPGVVKAILDHMEDPAKKSPFRPDRQIDVEINNSRMEADSLSLVEPVRAICNLSKLSPRADPRTRDTGYSSIHFLATVATTGGYHVREMRVEIQIRSAFEDAWGEIDHHIDYRERRGKKEIPRNKHLNVLKSMVDGLISYVDLIKRDSKELKEAQAPTIATSRSINTPQDQLARLTGLPADVERRVRLAFDIWSEAYASHEGEAPNPDLFKKGANAFEALLKDFAGQPASNKKLAAELDYVARIEYAYLLQYTGETADTEQAKSVYINILHERPDDVTANYRLGALYRKLGFGEGSRTSADRQSDLDHSKVYLDRALSSVISGVDERINKSHFLYDSLRREIGLTEWRISEDTERSREARLEALLLALKSAYDVIQNQAVPDPPILPDTRLIKLTRLSAINDFLYYRLSLAALGGEAGVPISEKEERRYAEQLYNFYESRNRARYEYHFLDTLLRLYIKDKVKAQKIALDLVWVLEKSVLDKAPNLVLPKSGTVRWYGALVRQLGADQADALILAHEFLNETSYPQPIDP